MINLDVYLIDESKNYTFHFPVNPLDKLSIPKERKFTTVDIIDFGESDIPDKGKKITEISFSTFFPKEYDPSFCRYVNIPTPESAVKLFEYWLDVENPLRLIITDVGFNGLVTLAKFIPEERAGEPGDKYIDLSFREFRDAKIGIYQSSVNSSSTAQLQDNRADSSTSDYQDGDTVKVTASALNVREGPGTNYNIIGTVYNGEKLTVFRQYDNWADCYWGNHGGFICLDYVTKA